jgi:beta-lactamase superfamily II metal-dependent hydrolase
MVLSAGHHGSGGSTPAALLERVAPQVVLISVGRENPFRLPAAATLRRIAAAGARVARTDRDGTLRIERRGARWAVCGSASGRRLTLARPGGQRAGPGRAPPSGSLP